MHVLLVIEFEWFVAFKSCMCAKNLFQSLKYLISALLCLESRKFNPDNINKL